MLNKTRPGNESLTIALTDLRYFVSHIRAVGYHMSATQRKVRCCEDDDLCFHREKPC